jgi:cystine transport system ATP-binding protein
MIELSGIVMSYGSTPVLRGIDLAIAEGSVTALIGPSGGGKSTLLRCVNLLGVPQEGTLKLTGGSASGDIEMVFHAHSRPHRDDILKVRRRTGMVFQAFNLFPHRTAIHNVTEGLTTVLGWEEDRAQARALELLEKVGLAHKADAYPSALSGGQQQRVAIARALAHSPEVLLCDEPTSALDPELAAEVVEVLRDLAAEGVTMLMATHDLRLAASVAREVAFLDAGTIVESGPPGEIFMRPREARTAAFVSTLTDAISDSMVI